MNITKGMIVIVDVQDYQWLSKWKWSYYQGYARRNFVDDCGKWQSLFMHQAVWERHNGTIPEMLEMDHINGNPLDNRLENLRVCCHKDNMANYKKTKRPTKSKFKGVSWKARNKKWQAKVCSNGIQYYLGLFEKEEDAARAYDTKARELFGEYAKLNFAEAVARGDVHGA